ncbi:MULTISPECIES: hypothetical protein [Burkholderia]|uniref:hypothetical protein n=1 Tax=Burkholderia TaxID=32008 RepID=UPI000530EA19|nr:MULTISPECIES: hypothetical protein [Burkholderia]KGS01640.1 hypothetical protein X946_782 [Burkholderia sp. ABCPW 111]
MTGAIIRDGHPMTGLNEVRWNASGKSPRNGGGCLANIDTRPLDAERRIDKRSSLYRRHYSVTHVMARAIDP